MLKISLEAARVNSGLTQLDVANKLHKSKVTIISWENGKTFPTLKDFDALCKLYNIPKDNILLTKNPT